MLPALMPGQKYDKQLSEALARLSFDASNVRSAGAPGTLVEKYLGLAATLIEQLRHTLRPEEVDRLVQTRRYWAVLGLDPTGRPARDLADLELVDLISRFETTAKEVAEESVRWQQTGTLIVPDTNIFLHALDDTIAGADWRSMSSVRSGVPVTIVLTLAVIDELDRTKRNESRSKARTTLKDIDALLGESTFTTITHDGGPTYLTVLVDAPGHVPLAHTDSEIVDRALTLHSRTTQRVLLLTGDTGMAIRARHAGLACRLLPTPDPAAK